MRIEKEKITYLRKGVLHQTVREKVFFNGDYYYRYPESNKRILRIYFSPHKSKRNQLGYLHREIFKYFNGEIKKGWYIWFQDGNTCNFKPSNLVQLSFRQKVIEKNIERGKSIYKINSYYNSF